MKLIFLGDSFTDSLNIDIEYAIQKNYIENNVFFYKDISFNKKNLSLLNNQQLKEIELFKKEQGWVNLLSEKIGLEYENLALSGSSLQEMYVHFLNYEINNFNKEIFYLFFLPYTSPTRMMISREFFTNKKDIRNFFLTYIYNDDKKDVNIFRKKFDLYYFYVLNINILMCLIHYLKNNNKRFLFLPTWESNIYNHFLNHNHINHNFKSKNIINFFLDSKKTLEEKKEENQRIKVFKNFFENFVFNEIEDQMNFEININDLKRLPCGHPNIESQEMIVEKYFNYVNDYIKK